MSIEDRTQKIARAIHSDVALLVTKTWNNAGFYLYCDALLVHVTKNLLAEFDYMDNDELSQMVLDRMGVLVTILPGTLKSTLKHQNELTLWLEGAVFHFKNEE